jgi:molybdopterin converting factor small subunit
VLRRLAGADQLLLEMPADAAVADALSSLEQRIPDLGAVLEATACARGDQLVHRASRLAPGDTLALIPPVSGG